MSLLDYVIHHTPHKRNKQVSQEVAVPRSIPSPESTVAVSLDFLTVFHQSLPTTSEGVFIINTANHLSSLCDYADDSINNVLPGSDHVFPYLHGLNNVRQRMFYGCESLTFPETDFFNLLTIDCTPSSGNPQLKSSIPLDDLLCPSSGEKVLDAPEDTTQSHIEYMEYDPFDHINEVRVDATDVSNRDYRQQVKLMAPLSHFLVYSSDFSDIGAALETAKVIKSLTSCSRTQHVYVVDMPSDEFAKVPTFDLYGPSKDQPISSINKQPFSCKLLKYEQNLIWKTYSMQKVFPRVTIGNLIDFSRLTGKSKDKKYSKKFKLYINCHENAEFPDIDLLRALFKSLVDDKCSDSIYLEFPAAGCVKSSTITFDQTLVYLNVLKLIDYCANKLEEEVLIFCFDGFTGLSLLTLSLGNFLTSHSIEDVIWTLIAKQEIKLYFFENDLCFLKKFERFINWLSATHKYPDGKLTFIEDMNYREINSVYLNLLKLDPVFTLKYDWFFPNCDNNFPARVLHNLYLGSLLQVSSKSILRNLSISKIISFGEKPSWLSSKVPMGEPIYSFNNGEAKVYEIHLDKTASVSGLPQVKSIIYIDNVKDDGKDSMLPLLIGCPEDVQDKIFSKPESNEKTMVHCRIGVSRSASLMMASLMKHLNMDLLEAYMYVRVKRFNIIIQPNLRLFYELYCYDEHLRMLRKQMKRHYCWSSLCNEIHKLNAFYIRK